MFATGDGSEDYWRGLSWRGGTLFVMNGWKRSIVTVGQRRASGERRAGCESARVVKRTSCESRATAAGTITRSI
jgi:hypothetical protein